MLWEHPLGVLIVWSPYRITSIHWLMARMPWSTFLRRLLILENAPSAPQISLPSRSNILALLLRFFWPIFIVFFWDSFVCTSATAVVELCSPRGKVPWSIVAVSRRVLASSWATTRTVNVFKVCFFLHAQEAVYGISKCTFCKNVYLKTLRH